MRYSLDAIPSAIASDVSTTIPSGPRSSRLDPSVALRDEQTRATAVSAPPLR